MIRSLARKTAAAAAHCEPAISNLSTASASAASALVDRWHRKHDYLRLSITDRCNFRCQYCMPEEGLEDSCAPAETLLEAHEIGAIVRTFVQQFGIRKIRLTGGEPTLRSDFRDIVRVIKEETAGRNISLGITTNGLLWSKYAQDLRNAGIINVNLSLDSMDPAKFSMMSRRPPKWFYRVKEVVDRAPEEGFNLKINCVVIKGINDDEIIDFVNLTKDRDIEIRFIEYMPFQQNGWSEDRMVPKADILNKIRQVGFPRPIPTAITETALLWRVSGHLGRIGIISSMTDAFCGGCNRLRVTADGQLKNCLFGTDEFDLRTPLREGLPLGPVIREGVWAKHRALGGKRDRFDLQEQSLLNRPMVSIGG
eukprot:GEMP01044379.1.p1 GENE.GEMP01044379.1~~GEMP01044379.1.p1  ORF type:complete len:383 (+),score=49.70 GEMP01044379.1:52-1149(+)